MALAQTITGLLGVYALLGLVFGVVFIARGVGVIDPEAREGSLGFRLIILPGCVALWPLLAWRWAKHQGPPAERNPHRDAAKEAP